MKVNKLDIEESSDIPEGYVYPNDIPDPDAIEFDEDGNQLPWFDSLNTATEYAFRLSLALKKANAVVKDIEGDRTILNAHLLDVFDTNKATKSINISTNGRLTFDTKIRYTMGDADKCYEYIKEHDRFDFLQKQLSATVIEAELAKGKLKFIKQFKQRTVKVGKAPPK